MNAHDVYTTWTNEQKIGSSGGKQAHPCDGVEGDGGGGVDSNWGVAVLVDDEAGQAGVVGLNSEDTGSRCEVGLAGDQRCGSCNSHAS